MKKLSKLIALLAAMTFMTGAFASCGDIDENGDDESRGHSVSDDGEDDEDDTDEEDNDDKDDDDSDSDDADEDESDSTDKDKADENEDDDRRSRHRMTDGEEETTAEEQEEITTKSISSDMADNFLDHIETVTGDDGKITGIPLQIVDYGTDADNKASVLVMWIDLIENTDYVFNHEYIKLTFRVAEDAPDGDYPLDVSFDFSNAEAKYPSLPENTYPGVIKVNNGMAEHRSIIDDGFACYVDDAACSQGETVDVYLCMENNPGIAAMSHFVKYDAGALELLSAEPVGEFADIAADTASRATGGDR